MAVVEIVSYADFWQKIEDAGNRLVIVKFYSDKCDQCRELEPVFSELSTRYRNVVFLKVDYKISKLLVSFMVVEVPTFILFKNSKEIDRVSYKNAKIILEEKIRNIDCVKIEKRYNDIHLEEIVFSQIIDIYNEKDLYYRLNEAGKNNLVIVNFYNEWSPPSKNILSFMNYLSKKYQKYLFLNVNVDVLKEIAKSFSIKVHPTIVFFRNFKEIKRIYGAQESEIENYIINYSNENKKFEKEDTLFSIAEHKILNSNRPIELNEMHLKTINGETGYWVNKDEEKKWKNIIPNLSEYKINKDDDPIIIDKKNDDTINYEQKIYYRYLKPPTPPPHGELLIIEDRNTEPLTAPPLIIRKVPPRPVTPPPIIIRERPPNKPERLPQQIVTIPSKKIDPPPRRVIVEKLPLQQPKPAPIIIERWLPYKTPKRDVIYIKRDHCPVYQHYYPVDVYHTCDYITPKMTCSQSCSDLNTFKNCNFCSCSQLHQCSCLNFNTCTHIHSTTNLNTRANSCINLNTIKHENPCSNLINNCVHSCSCSNLKNNFTNSCLNLQTHAPMYTYKDEYYYKESHNTFINQTNTEYEYLDFFTEI